MFFGDNVAHTIRRLTHRDKYNILYRPHGSCFDHFLRHIVSQFTDQFFVSNKVLLDDAINVIDGSSIEEILSTRLCASYNFQICSHVNKNIDATLINHIPLIYLIHNKEDLVDLENNLLGRYPYIALIANKGLHDIALKLDIDPSRIFYLPFAVQDNLEDKILNESSKKDHDVAIFLGGQDINQVENITKKLSDNKITTKIVPNHFSTKHLINVFSTSKVIVELNPNNIYNVIYGINCGVPSLIYNKEHPENKDYIYRNFDEMLEKIKYFTTNEHKLHKIGFTNSDSTSIKNILENINNRGLII